MASWIKFGPDGLSGFDASGVRRIWMDPASTSLSFYDSNSVRRMWLDGLNPGLSFYDASAVRRVFLDAMGMLFSFFDAAGISRCQMGNLPANGVSAAHFGFRVNDASGNPLYDSQGVIAAMSQPAGSVHNQSTLYTTSATTYGYVPGATLTFTLARTTTMFFVGTSNCNVIGAGPGNWGYVVFNLDGTNHTTDATVASFSQGGQVTNASLFYSVSLGAGSHTIALAQRVDGTGVTLQNFAYDLFAFQLGS